MRHLALFSCSMLLAISPWLACAGTVAVAPTEAASRAAQHTVINPETGELIHPPANHRRARQSEPKTSSNRPLQQAATQVIHRNGMTIVTVPPSLWPQEQVTIDAQGNVVAATERGDD